MDETKTHFSISKRGNSIWLFHRASGICDKSPSLKGIRLNKPGIVLCGKKCEAALLPVYMPVPFLLDCRGCRLAFTI